MVHGFFDDVSRWSREHTRWEWSDTRLVLYCGAVWLVCVVLGFGSLLRDLVHSPVRHVILLCSVSLTVWLLLPVVQVVVRRAPLRRALRCAVSAFSLAAGAGGGGALWGMRLMTRAPHIAADYAREATVPCALLALFGVVGIAVLAWGPDTGPRKELSV